MPGHERADTPCSGEGLVETVGNNRRRLEPVITRKALCGQLPRSVHALRALGNHSMYVVALVVARVVGLVTFPLYARILGPDDFGRYDLLSSLLGLAYSTLMVGMDFALAVRYYSSSPLQRRADLASAYLITVTLAIGTAAALIISAPSLAPLLLHTTSANGSLTIVALAVPFNIVAGLTAVLLRLEFRSIAFATSTVGGVIVGSGLGLSLVVGTGAGLIGATLGLTATHVVSAALALLLARGTFQLTKPSLRNTASILLLGLPLAPAAAAIWALSFADRFFVSSLVGFAELGLYAAGSRIASLLMTLQAGFQLAWNPIALRWALTADRDVKYDAALAAVASGGGALVIGIGVLAEGLITILAGPAYVEARSVVWILAGAVLFKAIFYVASIGLSLEQRSGILAWVTVAAAIANVILNVVLISRLGYAGAAVASFAAHVGVSVVGYLLSQRVVRLKVRFWRSIAIALGAVAVSALPTVLPGPVSVALPLACCTALGLHLLRAVNRLW